MIYCCHCVRRLPVSVGRHVSGLIVLSVTVSKCKLWNTEVWVEKHVLHTSFVVALITAHPFKFEFR